MPELLALAEINRTLFLLPLAVAISLVYSASRFENPKRILQRAVRLCLQILGGAAVVFAVLTACSWGL